MSTGALVEDSSVRVRFARFAGSLLLLLVSACSRSGDAPAPAASQKPAVVVAPPGLVAELRVSEPRRLFSGLRKLGGERVRALTSNFELTLFVVLGLPPRLAGYVRPETPVLGVVLAPAGAEPRLVLGLRTVRGSELVRELTRPDGGYRAESDATGLTVLVGQPGEPALGVLDEWLLTARDAATLRAGGPYVARSLGASSSSDAPLTLSMNRAALSGPLREALESRWKKLRSGLDAQARETRAERGRAPDFGDPDAFLAIGDAAVGSLLSLLASSERLTITLRPEDDRLALALVLVPKPDGELMRSIGALEVGPLDPLLGLPASAIAVLTRSTELERSESAENPADALRAVVGPRLAEKDAAPVADALRSFQRGRGNVMTFGFLTLGAPFLKLEVRDPKELERGVRGLLKLAKVPALAAPLEAYLGSVSFRDATTTVPGVPGPVLRADVAPRGGRGKPSELLVQVRGEAAVAVASENARQGLAALVTEPGALGASPLVAKLAERHVPAAIAVYADLSPFLLMRPGTEPSPALAVLGKRNGDAVLELALSAPACAAIAERVGSP